MYAPAYYINFKYTTGHSMKYLSILLCIYLLYACNVGKTHQQKNGEHLQTSITSDTTNKHSTTGISFVLSDPLAENPLDPDFAKDTGRLTTYYSVKDIPQYIQDFWMTTYHDRFRFANPGEKWNPGCCVTSGDTRYCLVNFKIGKKIAILTYEQGGICHNITYMAVRIKDNKVVDYTTQYGKEDTDPDYYDTALVAEIDRASFTIYHSKNDIPSFIIKSWEHKNKRPFTIADTNEKWVGKNLVDANHKLPEFQFVSLQIADSIGVLCYRVGGFNITTNLWIVQFRRDSVTYSELKYYLDPLYTKEQYIAAIKTPYLFE